MSADLLRKAAALMRERAGSAAIMAPPPWWSRGVWFHHFPVIDSLDEYEAVPWPAVGYGSTGADVVGHNVRQELSDHIASWHPDVAFAAAEAMEQHAHLHDTYDCWNVPCAHDAWARAYLGEPDA